MNDWGKFQDVKIKRASVELVWSDIGIKRFLCKLDMLLEECANILIGNEFGILCLAAKQAHSIAEKCGFVSIGEHDLTSTRWLKEHPIEMVSLWELRMLLYK